MSDTKPADTKPADPNPSYPNPAEAITPSAPESTTGEPTTSDTTPPPTPSTPSKASSVASTSSAPSDSSTASESSSTPVLPAELKTIHSSPERTAPISTPDLPTRADLLARATTFLASPTIRHAPHPEKLQFLLNKGLTEPEARSLLARTPTPPPAPVAPQAPPPVVVTYPEYLLPPPPAGPQPLITGPTLVKAAYFSAATAASFYVANNLLVAPMLNALTSARQDLLAHVGGHLDTLTARLAELAPEAAAKLPKAPAAVEEASGEETDEEEEELTELFSVDAGTQTMAEDEEEEEPKKAGPAGGLVELTGQMKVLVESHSDGTDGELMFLLEDLTGYLEGLTYDAGLSYSSPFGIGAGQSAKDKDDPVAKVKQEIRSVKGVLLHTKNFPAGRMGR